MKTFFICNALALFYITPVFAASATDGANVITTSFATLIAIVTALISSFGSLVLLWGIMEWGISMQSQDGTMQSMAFKRIGGGLVMVLAPQLFNAFIPQI